MDVLTVLNVLIEPNAAELVDGNSLVTALENIELVPSEFFVSRYYETLERQLSMIYRQFMLVSQGTLVGTLLLSAKMFLIPCVF